MPLGVRIMTNIARQHVEKWIAVEPSRYDRSRQHGRPLSGEPFAYSLDVAKLEAVQCRHPHTEPEAARPGKGRRGRIAVILERRGDSIMLRVKDDGIGFDVEAVRKSPSSLGLTLARILSEQLKGTFTLESAAGMKATLTFPA